MFRTLTALSLLVLLALLPAPVRAQDDRPGAPTTTTRNCGAYTLKLEQNGFGDPLDRVSVTRGAATYATVQDTMVSVDFCRDVTGDGVPEVLLAGFSGGAHCCFTHTLYSLTTPPRRLLAAFSAHTDTLAVRQLDPSPAQELIGADWRFAYAYGLSFADSMPLITVYSLQGGRYLENTRAYPALLRHYLSGAAPDTGPGELLADYAALLTVGQPGEADAYLRRVQEPYRAWLTNYGPDIRQALSDYGLRDWPTRAGAAPDAPRSGLGGSFSAPGTREFLALVGSASGPVTPDPAPEGGQAGNGTLKLYRPQGPGIVTGPALQTVAVRSDQSGYMEAAWWPAFTVRRASGRDDLIVRDARSGSVRYTTHRVSTAALTALTGDPLAVAATLLGDLSNVARQVAAGYAQPTPPRTTAQAQEVQRRIDASLTRAQPWAALTDAPLDLPHLGDFSVGAVEMPLDSADRAQVVATAEVGHADATTDSEYIGGSRFTVTIDLTRGPQGWTVTRWTLLPRRGELGGD